MTILLSQLHSASETRFKTRVTLTLAEQHQTRQRDHGINIDISQATDPSMVAPGIPTILNDFHFSDLTLGAFLVSIYVIGYKVGSLITAPMSEIYGRPVYHVSDAMFVIWTIACAFAPYLGALLAFRFFQGVAGVCILTIGGGKISDLIPAAKRGKFMSVGSMGI